MTSLCSASTKPATGAKWETCPDTGGRRWVDPWDTGLVDITGAGGLLVQVNGRAAQPVIDWLAPRDQQWKAGIKFVAIDMSATYAKAAREALPHAQLIVDPFHLVKRANEMLDAVRRRTTAAHRLGAPAKAIRSGSTGAGCCARPND
jgi:transposase